MIKTKKDSARGEGLDARARGEGRDASARGEVGEGNDNVVGGEQPCRGGMPMSEEHRREGVSMSEAGGQCQCQRGAGGQCQRSGGDVNVMGSRGRLMQKNGGKTGECQRRKRENANVKEKVKCQE